MPKRVPDNQSVDPVRSRLAASAAAVSSARPVVTIPQPEPEEEQGRDAAPTARRAAKTISRDRLSVNRKVMFTPDEADRNAETADMISSAFGSQATYSQITRAVWSILSGAEDAIKAGGKRARRLSVPSKGDHIAMAEYEEALAEFLATALRRS